MIGGFIFKPAPAKAIKNFTVEVTPATVGVNAEYKFQFAVEKELYPTDYITFIFPQWVNVPEIPDWYDNKNQEKVREMLENIDFNGQAYFACGGIPKITKLEDGSVEFKFISIRSFIPEDKDLEKVVVTFKPKFGILNPGNEGNFVFKVKTQREPTLVESQPVKITEKLPTPKLELVAQLPIYNQTMWYGAFSSVRKVKLNNDHPGFVYVRAMEGIIFESHYALGLYDSIDKRITREIYLCSGKELESNDGIECRPTILVDENNQIYVTVKRQIYVFSNYLNLYDILEPDLDTLHISSLLRLNFFKNNSIVALRDGIVLFIDKTSGVLTDHITIDKSIDPDIKGLKTVSLQDCTKDSILMYFSVDEEKAQNTRKVVAEVDMTTKTIKQKWIINKENYPKIPYTNNFFSLSYANPWFIFWTPCPSQDSTGVQLFIINTKTNQETLIELPLCSVIYKWLEKEGDTLYAYIRCPDGTDSDGYRQEGIYRIALNKYLP